nr:isoform 2 of protein far1-related sequence 2 [Quercus suber]
MFNSIDDIMKYYTRYGKEKGFAVAKRSSKKGDDGEVRYVTIACNRAGKPRNRSSNPLKLQSESKTDCKAQLRAVLCPDGKWILNAMKGTVFSEYELHEDVSLGESHQPAIFSVFVNEDTNDVNCNCRLFEFRGILCRHQIMVFIHREVYRIPDKYILKRWSKTGIRSQNKVQISYDNWFVKPEAQRYDKMCKAFYEVANLAADSEDRCDKVMAQIQELKREFENEEGVCGRNKPI